MLYHIKVRDLHFFGISFRVNFPVAFRSIVAAIAAQCLFLVHKKIMYHSQNYLKGPLKPCCCI